MYMAKAIAAFVGTVVTALFAASIIPVTGTWHVAFTVISILVTAITTYAVPNRGTPVVVTRP